MSGRFTLAGLLMGVTLVALVLAIVVPNVRYARRIETHAHSVVSVAASADGSTFAALMGDGRVLFWDNKGSLKSWLQTQGSFGAELAISFDGNLVCASPNQILEVNTRSVWRTLPASVSAVVFSPTEERIAVVNDYHVYTMDRDSRPRMISQGRGVAFSPDGKRLALGVKSAGRINIYDVTSGRLERGRPAMACDRLAWAPDGQSLAVVFSPSTTSEIWVDSYDLVGGSVRSAVVPGEKAAARWTHTLAYLPDGRRLLVGAAARRFKAFDADTLQPVAAADLSKVWYAAASLQDDTFITAESHAVDLWDAATLRPRRRLFEASPPPDHRPAICGLAIWAIVFALRVSGRIARSRASAKSLHAAPAGHTGRWHPD